MNKPCENCNQADNKKYKYDYFKCEKPCNNAKQCKKNDELLMRALSGERLDKIVNLQVGKQNG